MLLAREASREEQQDRKATRGTSKLHLGPLPVFPFLEPGERDSVPSSSNPGKALYTLDELATAMYQGGCSKEVLPEPWKLSEGKYSPGWVSRITGLVVEKRETARTTNSKVVPHPLPLGVFLKAQRDTELSEVVTLSWVSMMGGIGRYWGSGPQEVMLKVPCHGRKSSSL
jgi:hypothetical protein